MVRIVGKQDQWLGLTESKVVTEVVEVSPKYYITIISMRNKCIVIDRHPYQ